MMQYKHTVTRLVSRFRRSSRVERKKQCCYDTDPNHNTARGKEHGTLKTAPALGMNSHSLFRFPLYRIAISLVVPVGADYHKVY
jgi:hypothetical protein